MAQNALRDLRPPPKRPQENLQAYVKSARAPKPKFCRCRPLIYRGQARVMPPGSFLLPLYQHPRFLLREMWVFKPNVMEQRVKAFIRDAVPSEPITTDVDDLMFPFCSKTFNLSAPGFVSSVELLPLIENATDLTHTTSQVSKTVERIVSLIWPAVGQRHVFGTLGACPPIGQRTDPLCAPYFYTEIVERAGAYTPRAKMAVIVVSPWALSWADMYDMITLRKFPDFQQNRDEGWPRTWTRAHKVWAQIQDCCAGQGCSFFVLTTYEHWIFGSFHPDTYSQLVSTDIVSYTDSSPSILEWLVFWCASALRIPGSWDARVSYSKNPEFGNLKDFFYLSANLPYDSDSDQEFWTGA